MEEEEVNAISVYRSLTTTIYQETHTHHCRPLPDDLLPPLTLLSHHDERRLPVAIAPYYLTDGDAGRYRNLYRTDYRRMDASDCATAGEDEEYPLDGHRRVKGALDVDDEAMVPWD